MAHEDVVCFAFRRRELTDIIAQFNKDQGKKKKNCTGKLVTEQKGDSKFRYKQKKR